MGRKGTIWRSSWQRVGREGTLALFLLALVAYLSLTEPAFWSRQNLWDILVNSAYIAVAATGMTLVILSGGIDISVGSMLAVCSVVAGHSAKAGWPLPLVVLVTLLTGALLGAFNGLLAGWGGIPSIIVTLGTLSIYRGAMLWVTKGYWIRDLPDSFSFLGLGRVLGVPVPVWVMALTVATFAVLLRHTVWGRHLYAVGGSARAARLAGLSVCRMTVTVFTLCGALVGLATLVYATRFTVIQSNAGVGFELLVITAVVVGGTNIFGGRGSVWGSLLGVLLLSVIGTALTFKNVSAYWEPALQGLLILVAIVADRLREQRAVGGPEGERMGEGTAGGPAARFLGGWRRWVLSREGLLLLLLLATVSLMAHLSPRFLRLDNLFAMTRHFVEIGLLALPMTLVLITAGIDLSVGSMLGLSAVALGLTWRGTRSLATGVLAALGAGLLAGTANGLLVARLHIPALIVTLATLAIYRGLALGLSQAEAVHDFPESFYWLGQGYVGPFPAQLLLFGGLAMAATIFLSCTTVGRSLYALGGNEETARLSGLPVAQLKLLVYALSGLLAGLAGVTYVSRVATAKPDAGLGLELDVITAVVLGGTSVAGGEGTVLGSVLGMLIISALRNGLTLIRFPTERQAIMVGLLLIAAVGADRLLRRR